MISIYLAYTCSYCT